MKKLILAILTLFTLHSYAQEHSETKRERKEARMEQVKHMSAEDIASIKSKKMTLQLDLTDQQQQEVYNLILANAEKRKALKAERKAAKEEQTKLTSEEKITLKKAKLDEQIQMKRELKKILTDEQYAKFEELGHKRMMGKKRKKTRS